MDSGSTIKFEFVDPAAGEHQPGVGNEPQKSDAPRTADALLSRAARLAPEALAFADPPNRQAFGLRSGGRVTYQQADAAADAIAAQLSAHALKRGDVIALQVPNIVEGILLVAGAWRAGLTAVPLPMMWRLDELHHALAQINPAAVAIAARFAGTDHAALMCEAASRHVDIRYIFGLGDELHDGVTPISDWFAADPAVASGPTDRVPVQGSEPALMTWAAGAEGTYPVPRSHQELMALGEMAVRQLGISKHDVVLSTYPLTTISSIGGVLMPALLAGAPVIMHHPFDYDVFTAQLREHAVTYTAVPDAVIQALAEGGDLDQGDIHLQKIGRVWSSPHRPPGEMPENVRQAIFDIAALSELGLIVSPATRDGTDGDRGGLPLGKIGAGHDKSVEPFLETRVRGSVAAGENSARLTGDLLVRGTTVPKGPFTTAGALTDTLLRPDSQGFLNTRIRCTVDETTAGRFRCQRDEDLIYHGGVTVGAAELDRIYAGYPDFLDAAAFAIADDLMGERIYAAVVPRPDQTPSLTDFKSFLLEKGIAAFKAPDQLVIVNTIPRDAAGHVLRANILSQIGQ